MTSCVLYDIIMIIYDICYFDIQHCELQTIYHLAKNKLSIHTDCAVEWKEYSLLVTFKILHTSNKFVSLMYDFVEIKTIRL